MPTQIIPAPRGRGQFYRDLNQTISNIGVYFLQSAQMRQRERDAVRINRHRQAQLRMGQQRLGLEERRVAVAERQMGQQGAMGGLTPNQRMIRTNELRRMVAAGQITQEAAEREFAQLRQGGMPSPVQPSAQPGAAGWLGGLLGRRRPTPQISPAGFVPPKPEDPLFMKAKRRQAKDILEQLRPTEEETKEVKEALVKEEKAQAKLQEGRLYNIGTIIAGDRDMSPQERRAAILELGLPKESAKLLLIQAKKKPLPLKPRTEAQQVDYINKLLSVKHWLREEAKIIGDLKDPKLAKTLTTMHKQIENVSQRIDKALVKQYEQAKERKPLPFGDADTDLVQTLSEPEFVRASIAVGLSPSDALKLLRGEGALERVREARRRNISYEAILNALRQ